MGDSPSAPPPPDYAKANREGIETDIETLPLRRAIEQASALGEGAVFGGKYYKNPADAQVAKLAATRQKDADLQSLNEQIAATKGNPWGWQERNQLMARRDTLQKERDKLGDVGDFTGLGDDTLARKYLGVALDGADELARRQLKMRQEQGVANVEQTVKELRAADPEGYEARQRIQRSVESDVLNYDPEAGDMGTMLRDAREEYALGSKLDASTAQEVEQAARAAQSARGNILGIGAATQEAMALGSAGEARKNQRLSTLNTLEGQSYGRKQQGVASASSFLLGNPITNQFGSLGGAQSGALNYQPQSPTRGIGQDPNAGSRSQGYAQQNYSQAMDAYNQAAAKGNPWMSVASGVIGAGAGAFTGGLGAGAAGSLFSKPSGGVGPTQPPSAWY
ncbi:MAG: hypothetical protein RL077_366 [Verrucomicrobiota bacterium]|jgi:hypothetical protein